MKFEIKSWISGEVLFEWSGDSLKLAVEAAINSGADLRGADLRDADLCDADFSDAVLRGADLCDADLCDADLRGADLCDADLRGADLRGADLCGADFSDIKHDLWAVIAMQPNEVVGLKKAIQAGRIDGSCYQGDCCCLVGTIAKLAGTQYDNLQQLKPDASRPIERWFLGIKRGETPETNQISRLTVEWIDEWLNTAVGAAYKD